MGCFLNVDLGEKPSEPEELYALAHVANLACGGHAGDEATIEQALGRCAAAGARPGAHPSYADREGFGRRTLALPARVVRAQLAAQCGLLLRVARRTGAPIAHVKPHGALYHDADLDPALARAVIDAACDALGVELTVIGPPGGALEEAARARGLSYAREGFADRGVGADGKLLPRGAPGALITEPAAARARAAALLASGRVDTICVHGDTPGAVAIATAVRELLDAERPGEPEAEPMGDGAMRLALPAGASPARVLAALRAGRGFRDVVVTETHACVHLAPRGPHDDPAALLAATLAAPGPDAEPRTVVVSVRYDGPDLPDVARRCGLAPGEVAAFHAGRAYEVRTIGFLPGFAYLGELDPRIRVPRLPSPRQRVPARAVGIAGARTGIYPLASPGGWNLIGTAVRFDPFTAASGAALRLGDRVRFEPA